MMNIRTGTKKYKLLQFIGSRDGTRYSEMERFICELNGYDYDLMVPGYRYDYSKRVNVKCMTRRWKGIWGTTLCYGKEAILPQHCVKGADKKWRLNEETKRKLGIKAPSSLESNFPSDEIQGNSKVVSVTRMVAWPGGNAPQAPIVAGPATKPIPADAPTIAAPVAVQTPESELQKLEKQLQAAREIREEAGRRLKEATEMVRVADEAVATVTRAILKNLGIQQ